MFTKRLNNHSAQIARSVAIFLMLGGLILLTLSVSAAANRRKPATSKSSSPGVAITSTIANAGSTLVSSGSPQCSLPGVQVVSDPANDQNGNQVGGPTQQLDITDIYFAELGTDTHTHSITMKVQNLTGTLIPNATWQVNMNVADTNGTLRTIFVNMNTTDNPPNAAFNFGYNSTLGGSGNDTSQGTAGVVSGSFSADGTITIKLNTANVISFNDVTSAHQFDVDVRQPGVSLSGINGVTSALVGVLGNGVTTTVDTTGNGTTTYLTVGNAACGASGSPTPTPTSTPTPTATPTPTPGGGGTAGPGAPRYQIYMSPQGVADSAGEPSIGSNWTKESIFTNTNVNGSTNSIPNGGSTLYFGGFLSSMLKVTFSDCSSPAGATWDQKPLLSASTPRAAGDPILFTDHITGRTFVAQLEGLTPAGATIDITDNDGDSFIPSDGVVPSDVDHETLGGGPYHTPLPNGVNPIYPNAVYYASQSVAEARCLRSDSGGLVFSQGSQPMFTAATCAGLHGHVKITPAGAPDAGTAYVPDKTCGTVPLLNGGNAAVAFSEDNGITWAVSEVPDGAAEGEWDPSVGIASDGTIYLGYQDINGHAKIAVGHHADGGGVPGAGAISWEPSIDVGAQVGVNNITFPEVVAGDPTRAAFAFYGTTTADCLNTATCHPVEDHTGGANDDPSLFTGVWYLFVASTFDGGQTWSTQNITPGDPIQRGPICGGSTCRN
ncbi:MAG TPA: hypothetical protein VGM62_18890, partial [Chthoniobacterales bacterium]